MVRKAIAVAAGCAVVAAGLGFGTGPAAAVETISTTPSTYDPAQTITVRIDGFPNMAAANGYIFWLDFQNMTGAGTNTGASTGAIGSQTDCTAQTGVTFTKVSGAGTATPNGQSVVGSTNGCEWISTTSFKFTYTGTAGLDNTSVVDLVFPIGSFSLPAGGQYGVNFTAGATKQFQLSYVCWGNCPSGTTGVATSAPPTITIDIDANGGQCTTSKITGFASTWSNAPSATNCFKPGTQFIGFNTSADGSGLAFPPGSPLHLTGDNRLYAVYEAFRAPGVPRDVVAVAGRNQITVSWQAPTDPGSYDITNYRVQAVPSGRVCITRLSSGDPLSCTFGFPATNTQYGFKVAAFNGVDWGVYTAESNAVSPYDLILLAAERPKSSFLQGLAGWGSTLSMTGRAPGYAPGTPVTPQWRTGNGAWVSETRAGLKVGADRQISWSTQLKRSLNKAPVTVRFVIGDAASNEYSVGVGSEAAALSAPRNIRVDNVVNKVKVSWDAPRFTGGETITGYTMCAVRGSGSLCRNVSADGQGVFFDLEPGKDVTITVAARTATRTGPVAEAKQKVSPVEASVRITRRVGQEIRVEAEATGFKAGTKFRLESAVAVPGEPASAWRWEELQSFTGNGNVNRLFSQELGSLYEGETIAVRLVTPNGLVYSRLSRP